MSNINIAHVQRLKKALDSIFHPTAGIYLFIVVFSEYYACNG